MLHFVQAIVSLERTLVSKRQDHEVSGSKGDKPAVNPQIYCILGHLHLLLENFSKGRPGSLDTLITVLVHAIHFSREIVRNVGISLLGAF